MKKYSSFAYAKINLTLDIVRRRDDGFHEIKSLMQKVSLHDVISVSETKSGIEIVSDSPLVPTDSGNICYKAAEKYLSSAGIPGGVKIEIEKHIPVAAGLAGGSADGSAVLELMKKLYPSDADILQIANSIGSDLAFCLGGVTSVCMGRGEKISETVFSGKEKYHIVIAKGTSSLSTPAVYKAFDQVGRYKDYLATDRLIPHLNSGDDFTPFLANDFEDIVIPQVPEIFEIKSVFADFGAIASLMSGSGPSVFGIFLDRDQAKNAKTLLLNKGFDAHLCRFI